MQLKTAPYYPRIYQLHQTFWGQLLRLGFVGFYLFIVGFIFLLALAEIIPPPVLCLSCFLVGVGINTISRRILPHHYQLSQHYQLAPQQVQHEIDTEYFSIDMMNGSVIKIPFRNLSKVQRTMDEYRLYQGANIVAIFPLTVFESIYEQEQFEMILRSYKLLDDGK